MSDQVKRVLMASWNTKSIRQYSTPIRKWLVHCRAHNIDPFQATIEQGAEFITSMFNSSDLKYSSFNTTRSALSIMINPVNGTIFGKSKLISRLLRGIYKYRQSLPKYNVTYDANIVLNYLSTLSPNSDIPLQHLVHKLTALMCLLAGQRAQTLGTFCLDYMHIDNDRCIFYIPELVKQSRPKFHQAPVEFLSFSQNTDLCPVECIHAYLERTLQFRESSHVGKFFLSYAKPHKPVTSGTLAKYMLRVLLTCGINIQQFSAHSLRSSSTSCAEAKGLSLKEISKAAGWSNETTFSSHYRKLILNNFGDTILKAHSH